MSQGMTSLPTFLDGVFLVLNGVSDLASVLDSPNCGEFKVAKTGIRQDLYSTIGSSGQLSRNQFTNLEFPDMTLGTASKVEEAIRQTNQNLNPGAIMVTSGSPIQLTGEYHEVEVRRLSEELKKPIFSFPSASLSGDFLDGFRDALVAVAAALPLDTSAKPEPDTVGIIGFPYLRNELDDVANVQELVRLLKGLGLRCTVVFPSGRTFADYGELSRVERIIGLPYGAEAAEYVGTRLGRPVLQLPVPMGLDGTSRWLRAVAAFTGREQQAELLIEGELRQHTPLLRRIVNTMFVHKRIVVAADPYLAHGLIPGLTEIGLEVAHLTIRTRHSQRLETVLPTIRAAAANLPIGQDLSIPEMQRVWAEQAEEGVDLVIGSTLERASLGELEVPYLEMGFPCYVRHALYSAPWVGFQGLVWLADRTYNLLSEHRYVHSQVRSRPR